MRQRQSHPGTTGLCGHEATAYEVRAGPPDACTRDEDADSPTPHPLVHAIAWNLPGRDAYLPAGALRGPTAHGDGHALGLNSLLRAEYLPPDPPPGHGPHRYDREQPWYTFDRDRRTRDSYRRRDGIPDDHQLPQVGDSPADRAAARRNEYWRARAEERERRFLAGEFRDIDVSFACSCPPGCDDLDAGERPRHITGCPCSCDLD